MFLLVSTYPNGKGKEKDGAIYGQLLLTHSQTIYRPLLLPWGGMSVVVQRDPHSSVVSHSGSVIGMGISSGRGLISILLQQELPAEEAH